MIKNQRGFTLIELLVVIAIIGILASVIIASLNTARAKARDAQRLNDIKQIQTALALYYDQYGTYPVSTGASQPGGAWSTSTDSSWTTLATTLATYIKLPVDPKNNGTWGGSGTAYSYFSQFGNCAAYMLVYSLETSSTGLSPGVTGCSNDFYNYKNGSNGYTIGVSGS